MTGQQSDLLPLLPCSSSTCPDPARPSPCEPHSSVRRGGAGAAGSRPPASRWAQVLNQDQRLSWRGVSQGQVTQHPLHPAGSLQLPLHLSLHLHIELGVIRSRHGATGDSEP